MGEFRLYKPSSGYAFMDNGIHTGIISETFIEGGENPHLTIGGSPMLELNRETHEYSNKAPGVTKILTEVGIIDASFYTEEGRDRGSAVHLACEYYDEGSLDMDSIDPRIEGYLQSYIKWLEVAGIKPEWIELPQSNGLYAGMPDRIMVSRPRAQYDLKTGAYQHWHRIQSALYINLLEDPYSYSRYGVYLKPDGKLATTKEFPKTEYQQDLNIGLSAVNIYHWKRRNNGHSISGS